MWLPIVFIDFLEDKLRSINDLEHLLENHALKFEPTHVSVVCHHSHGVSDYQQIEVLIENGCNLWFLHDDLIQCEHCL